MPAAGVRTPSLADYLINKNYHDRHYGWPIQADNELYCRLVLEINQAGLSWTTLLHKEINYRNAYHQFDISIVANYTEQDVQRLLTNAGIIRNQIKIRAAIHNANVIGEIQLQAGSFKNWLDAHTEMSLEEWVQLFKKTFKFMGMQIVGEFLMSTGYLRGAHDEACPIFKKIQKLKTK